ncbi:hypothetical protein ACQU0X_26705 [Pseudovibrio ascidiaceicola]|uniref:hypothetical protein n=1 Tax=Pseudovibrio ascidiaceicola TaxID=285279 RepID=UPI003D365855
MFDILNHDAKGAQALWRQEQRGDHSKITYFNDKVISLQGFYYQNGRFHNKVCRIADLRPQTMKANIEGVDRYGTIELTPSGAVFSPTKLGVDALGENTHGPFACPALPEPLLTRLKETNLAESLQDREMSDILFEALCSNSWRIDEQVFSLSWYKAAGLVSTLGKGAFSPIDIMLETDDAGEVLPRLREQLESFGITWEGGVDRSQSWKKAISIVNLVKSTTSSDHAIDIPHWYYCFA